MGSERTRRRPTARSLRPGEQRAFESCTGRCGHAGLRALPARLHVVRMTGHTHRLQRSTEAAQGGPRRRLTEQP
jgi:hypothetical protein